MKTLNPKHKNLLIILPAYNEAQVLGKVLADIQKIGFSDICVVNDGSQDDTAKIAKAAGAMVLSHPINRGAGAAVQTGLTYASQRDYSYALLMDSDGQHFPEDIFLLLEKMEASKADIVIGNRFINKENSVPGHRFFYNQIANIFTNVFCRNNYPDTQSGFRLLNKKAIQKIRLCNRGFGFCSEMLIQAEQLGLVVESAPIQVLYTSYSMSKGQSLLQGIRTAKSILWNFIFK